MIHKRIQFIWGLLFLFTVTIPGYSKWSQPIVLQPFGNVDPSIIEAAVKGLKEIYGPIEIHVRPAIDLPKYAYYPPRKRYRAQKLLYFLRSYYVYKVKKKYGKIIGLTIKDISITKGEYEDWGIFGLAFLDVGPAVVSTFRLKRKATSIDHFYKRLVKVMAHELGHTFGLDHCPSKKCLMQDCKGTIKTVDNSHDCFCPSCRKKLFRLFPQLKFF